MKTVQNTSQVVHASADLIVQIDRKRSKRLGSKVPSTLHETRFISTGPHKYQLTMQKCEEAIRIYFKAGPPTLEMVSLII